MSARTDLSRAAVNTKLATLISTGAIWLAVFLTGFVINEPAPYELYMVALVVVWSLFGLRISRTIAPMAVLLVLFVIGGMISMLQMPKLYGTPLYLSISLFLAITAVFYAAVLQYRPDLYRIAFQAWIMAGIGTATLGILGYFGFFGGAFTLYDRAAGGFKDPNVFGPFLVAPAIYCLYRILTGRARTLPFHIAALVFLCAGIFLSFSRGAWGLMALSAMLLTGALFLHSESNRFRLRLIVLALVALTLMMLALVVLLQIPAVAELFSARAQLVQEYDGSRLGRFARFGIGFGMALENPLGIGPLNFGRDLGEDTHNMLLKAALDYSWLGFAAYLTLILWTLASGFRILFRDRPWQPYLLIAYVVFFGHVVLGTVIDTNHWRHFYLLLGMVWGAMALEARHQTLASRRMPVMTSGVATA